MKIINENFKIEKDELNNGIFVKYVGDKIVEGEFEFLSIENKSGVLCSHRTHPWFNEGMYVKNVSELPYETQWICTKEDKGVYTLVYPLVEEPLRASLFGCENNNLGIFLETGDNAILSTDKICAFIIEGTDIYKMLDDAPKSIVKRLKTCTLKEDKKMPEFVKYFGWCTWDSFYEKVNADDIKSGLESLKNGGFVPKFLLLDDGWQTVCENYENRGYHKLSSLSANEKFEKDLSKTVAMAKNEYGVKEFFVWHAMLGYWGGLEPTSAEMQKYNVKMKKRVYSKRLIDKCNVECEITGMPESDKLFDFYNDYHRKLSKAGIDGVKVDVQFATEALGQNDGGRVRMTRKAREALEASVNLNFSGELINCMCGSNDLTYHTKASNVTRTSDDFFPLDDASHGKHIFSNAATSMWIGGYTFCDWDMFQTKHKFGAFHAASRAISGSPIYVSDKVDEHDFDIINKLTTTDGKILLAEKTARPCEDSLFMSPNDKELYKIFNYNKFGGVIGIFNLTSDENTSFVKSISPADIPNFKDGKYVVYLHNKNESFVLDSNDKINIELKGIQFEIATVMKIENNFAPIGLIDKYNTGASVLDFCEIENIKKITVSGKGKFAFYCITEPKKIVVNNTELNCTYKNNIATVELPQNEETTVFV